MSVSKLELDSDAYKLLFKYSEGYLFLVDQDFKIVNVNQNMIEDLGYSGEDIIGKKVHDFVVMEDFGNAMGNLIARLEGKEAGPSNVAVRKKNGEILHFRTSGRAFPVYKGKERIGVLVSGINTTELNNKEREAEDNKKRYKALADNVKEGIYSTLRGIFVSTNKSMQEMFGYTEEEMKGMPSWNLAFPEQREKIKEEMFRKVMKGDSSPSQIECVRKDGSRIFVEITITPTQDVDFNFGTVIDITREKKAERELRKSKQDYKELFENIADGIWVVDKNLRIVDTNKKACDMLEYSKEELIGKYILDFYADKSVEDSVKKNMNSVVNGKDIYVERKFVTKSGKIIPVAINSRGLEEDNSQIIESLRNLSEIKELKSKLKKLESAKRSKLTQKERKVFYGLARWPDSTDQELSKKIDVKRSTVTAIKNKLRKENYYHVARIPTCEIIGCELVAISKHRFSQHLKTKHDFTGSKMAELIFHLSSDNDSIGISIGKSFPELKDEIDKYSSSYEKNEIIKELDHIYFPLSKVDIVRCFDFASVLRKIFGIDINEKEDLRNKEFIPEKQNLTKKEKKILYALVRYPEDTDTSIAKKTNTARVTVSSTKKNLLKKGILKTVIVPNFQKLGDYMVIFTKGFIGLNSPDKSGKKQKNFTVPEQSFLRLEGSKEIVDIGLYTNYENFKKLFDTMVDSLSKRWPEARKPEYIVFPMNSLKEFYLNFADMTKKCLDMEDIN